MSTGDDRRHLIKGGQVALEGDTPVSFQEERFFKMFAAAKKDGGVGKPFGLPTLRLEGPLDVRALEQAVDAFVRRHRVLWSVFREEAGKVCRRQHPPEPRPLRVVDLRHLAGKAQLDALVHDLAANQHAADDLTGPPPRLLASLYRLGDTLHALEVVSTLGVFDYESGNIFSREVSALYPRFSRGEAVQVKPAPVQFCDYALWSHTWHRGAQVQEAVAFFRERLGQTRGIGELLPADAPRAPVEERRKASFFAPFRQKGTAVRLKPEVTAALRALVQARGCTLEAATYAAWAAVLGQRAGVSDVVMRTTFDTRPNLRGVEEVVGFFSNFTYLRLDLGGAPSFAGLVERAQRELDQARSMPELQLVPFAYPELDDRFRVLYMHYGTRDEVIDFPSFPGVKVEDFPIPDEYAELFYWPTHWQDWSVGFFERPGGFLGIRVLCNTALWAEATGRAVAEGVARILERGAAEPDAPLPPPPG